MDKIYIQDIKFRYYKYYNVADACKEYEILNGVDVNFNYKMMNGTINIPIDKLKDISLKEIIEYIAKEMR
ncbi:hypothetical protein NPD9_1705 [Clostridium botulinum]|uniref:hypothetical protein n=1 Tax=Clostridium botulinum TaxID=1491 RepID=UPI000FCCB0FA|nr:hypothetical protein [Clostridium botulinum]RUT53140.1 hypothetical protein NPD9_1705 [Clostridium botulinum]